jgi:hypothetical protein
MPNRAICLQFRKRIGALWLRGLGKSCYSFSGVKSQTRCYLFPYSVVKPAGKMDWTVGRVLPPLPFSMLSLSGDCIRQSIISGLR